MLMAIKSCERLSQTVICNYFQNATTGLVTERITGVKPDTLEIHWQLIVVMLRPGRAPLKGVI
ncbi:hypothetical protein POAR111328_05365 [Polynucleobacter arcticus]